MNAAIYLRIFFSSLFLFMLLVYSCFLFSFFLVFLFSGGLVFSLIVSVETQSVTISWRYVWFLAPNRIMLYSHVPYHNDTIIKQTHDDYFNKIFTSHFIARVQKGYSRFACERELEIEQNCLLFNYDFLNSPFFVFLC